MASFSPLSFSVSPNLSSRLSPTQINRHLAPPLQFRPPTPTPPPPDLPLEPNQPSKSPSANPILPAPPSSRKWSSLFESKPRNAGSYMPPPMKLVFKGKTLLPTDEIFEAAKEQWDGYLIGHFLDHSLPFSVVVNRLKYLWQPSGGIKIRFTGTVFFFYFESLEDREKILQADPVLIQNKLFIVRPWVASLGDLNKAITSVPVWIKLTNLPLYGWSKKGISYLAMRIGKFLCMDLSTEKLERLEYAKCMVEITPHDELPTEFPVELPDGSEQVVFVTYLWRPEICVKCKSFGHLTVKCDKFKEAEVKEISRKVAVRRSNETVDVCGQLKRTEKGSDTRTDHNANDKRIQSNPNASSSVYTKQPSSMWTEVLGKKKDVARKFPISNLTKQKGLSGITEVSCSRYDVLTTLQGEDLVDAAENVSEEGEIRQVSELLSRAFPPYVDPNVNATSLIKACSDKMADIVAEVNPRKQDVTSYEVSALQVEVQKLKENNEGSFAEHDVDQDSRIIREGKNLDSFLQTNFDCVENYSNVNKKKMKMKDKAKHKVEGKGVRESIEELRAEIKSGKLDHFLCEEKLKLMDTMIYNYNSMEVYAAERDRMGLIQNEMKGCKPSSSGLKPGFLNLCVDISSSKPACLVKSTSPLSANKHSEKAIRNPGPYDHIQPPPGFKAPPESSFNTPTMVLSSGRSTESNHMTRSKKIELLIGPNDDKG